MSAALQVQGLINRPGRPGMPLAAVRARAPLRLGLAGGGTDLPSYATRFGGAVLNATIDRYAFASIRAREDGCLVFESCDLGREEAHPVGPAAPHSRLVLHRGVHERMLRDHPKAAGRGMTVTTAVDAPLGSGLGSSSALVVALVQAYATWLGVSPGRHELARLAFSIEREDLGLAGGQQDQYSAAYGGLNFLEFPPDGRVIVTPLHCAPAALNELESSLVICFSGESRLSARIVREQSQSVEGAAGPALAAMHQLKHDAHAMREAVVTGDPAAFAAILERSWAAKKRTAPGISTSGLEALEALGRRNGALAAKVSGAGGGGFMMFVVPVERRYRLIAALIGAGCQAYPVKLTERGSEAWGIAPRQ